MPHAARRPPSGHTLWIWEEGEEEGGEAPPAPPVPSSESRREGRRAWRLLSRGRLLRARRRPAPLRRRPGGKGNGRREAVLAPPTPRLCRDAAPPSPDLGGKEEAEKGRARASGGVHRHLITSVARAATSPQPSGIWEWREGRRGAGGEAAYLLRPTASPPPPPPAPPPFGGGRRQPFLVEGGGGEEKKGGGEVEGKSEGEGARNWKSNLKWSHICGGP